MLLADGGEQLADVAVELAAVSERSGVRADDGHCLDIQEHVQGVAHLAWPVFGGEVAGHCGEGPTIGDAVGAGVFWRGGGARGEGEDGAAGAAAQAARAARATGGACAPRAGQVTSRGAVGSVGGPRGVGRGWGGRTVVRPVVLRAHGVGRVARAVPCGVTAALLHR